MTNNGWDRREESPVSNSVYYSESDEWAMDDDTGQIANMLSDVTIRDSVRLLVGPI